MDNLSSSPSLALPLVEIINSYTLAYELNPTDDKLAVTALNSIIEHITSQPPLKINPTEHTHILKKALIIYKNQETQSLQDQIITSLCIKVVEIFDKVGYPPLALISFLDHDSISSEQRERVLKPYEGMMHYHRERDRFISYRFRNELILKAKDLKAAVADSEDFWSILAQKLKEKGLDIPELTFIKEKELSLRYSSRMTRLFFKEKPLLSFFGDVYTLQFHGEEVLSISYEVLLLCGMWFRHLLNSNGEETRTKQIDFQTLEKAGILIFKHGFEVLLGKVTDNSPGYPNLQMRRTAFLTYLTLTDFLQFDPQKIFDSKEERFGRDIYHNFVYKPLYLLCRGLSFTERKEIASECRNFQELLQKLTELHLLEKIKDLRINAPSVSLTPEIRLMVNLTTIYVQDLDLDTFPPQILELKNLKYVNYITLSNTPHFLPKDTILRKEPRPRQGLAHLS